MSYDIHQEKTYSQDCSTVYNAALKSVEKLKGQMLACKPNDFHFEGKFDKTPLGKVLGERTNLPCTVQSDGQQSKVMVDAYPLDAVGRKLMFGARKGVTQEIINLFTQHLENNLMQREFGMYYLKEEEVQSSVKRIVQRFPSGQIMFDATSKLYLKIQKTNVGINATGARIWRRIDDPHELETWNPRIKLVTNLSVMDKDFPRIKKMPGGVRFIVRMLALIPAMKNMGLMLRYRF
jgi:hypothetical protein